MRSSHASLFLVIGALILVASLPVSAKGSKSNSALMKNTATGSHYKNISLTPNKPKTPVVKKPAVNTAADKTTKPLIKLDGVKGESLDDKHKD